MCAAFSADLPLISKTVFGEVLHGIFVGRVERNKGVFELLEALAELKRRGIPFKFTFLGAYGEDFEAAVKAKELSDRVVLAGLAPSPKALNKFYDEADFFCLPTYTEGFPRVLYEAMAHGLPCLTTLVGGIPSRMRAGENCLALEPRSADSIVKAVTALTEDRELLKRLSAASLDTFIYWRKRFSGSSHARQLRELINAALAEGKRH